MPRKVKMKKQLRKGWKNDDVIAAAVGDRWLLEMDVSQMPEDTCVELANEWLEEQGLPFRVSSCSIGDDNCDWYVVPQRKPAAVKAKKKPRKRAR